MMAIISVLTAARWRCRKCGAEFLIADDRDPEQERADYHMRSEHGTNDAGWWERITDADDHSARLTQSWYSFELARSYYLRPVGKPY